MGLYNRANRLLTISEATDEEQLGSIYAVVPQSRGDYNFRLFVDLKLTGGGGTPSATVHVETSHDGEGWIPIVTPVTLSETGEVHEFLEVAAVGPLIRARTVLAGTVKPHHEATVELAATARFKLVFKSKGASSASVDLEDIGEVARIGETS